MSTETQIPAEEPTIVMTRVYTAPRALVWEAMTEPKHVRQWWGGAGFSNPVCEMDVRPGGSWKHVMRFPDGGELSLDFVFVEVDKPTRLVWQNADHGERTHGPPTSVMTVTLDDLGGTRTRWTLVARFASIADRDAARKMGFSGPIESSNEALTSYLVGMISTDRR